MDIAQLRSLSEAARLDADVFSALTENPEDLIEDFEAISEKAQSAIAGMSPDAAMSDLLASPSNAHCIRTSCGTSSFAPIT